MVCLVSGACGGNDAAPASEPAPVATTSGGAASREPLGPPRPNPNPYPGRTGAGTSPEDPVSACGPGDSYEFVAGGFKCPEGGNPLGGDPNAGAQARAGNVGANSTGHIIDHYQVPCQAGPVDVYVDMYGCPEMEARLRSFGGGP